MRPADLLQPAAMAAACAYAAWNARDLLDAWRDSPYDRAGVAAFAVWLCAALVARGRRTGVGPLPAAWGVAVSVAGAVAEINALEHAGLALVLASVLAPAGVRAWVWIAGAVSWAPALGYACSSWMSPQAAGGLRVALAAAAAAALLLGGNRGRQA